MIMDGIKRCISIKCSRFLFFPIHHNRLTRAKTFAHRGGVKYPCIFKMAHTGIFATSDQCLVKAGAGVSATVSTEARINKLCFEVEGLINCVSRFNWNDNFASMNSDVRNILGEVESNLVAIYLIQFDMSGYTSRIEAEDMINVLRDGALRGLAILRDQKVTDFLLKESSLSR